MITATMISFLHLLTTASIRLFDDWIVKIETDKSIPSHFLTILFSCFERLLKHEKVSNYVILYFSLWAELWEDNSKTGTKGEHEKIKELQNVTRSKFEIKHESQVIQIESNFHFFAWESFDPKSRIIEIDGVNISDTRNLSNDELQRSTRNFFDIIIAPNSQEFQRIKSWHIFFSLLSILLLTRSDRQISYE